MFEYMEQESRDFLCRLLDEPSPSGWEYSGQKIWMGEATKYADSVGSDAYGNAWACLTGKAETPRIKVMLESHADEIGFIVRQVTKEGFLRLDRIGGSDVATARGRKLCLLGTRGEVRGIIGNTAIHLRKDALSSEKAPKVEELFVDVGASNEKEVAELGIRVGTPAVYAESAEFVGENRLVCRALDNRISGFILTLVLQRLADQPQRPEVDLICLNAVQEEIGGNGATMATHRLQPDLAICLDVTHATDSPGIDQALHGEIQLAAGPTVTHGTCNHPALVQRLIEVAEKGNIPLQHEASSRYSGTDTDSIFTSRDGVVSALVSLPLRYMHSVVETVDLRDVEHTVNLLVNFLNSLEAGERFGFQFD